MCGIAGLIRKDGQQADAAVIQAMTNEVAHRGPDGDGIYCDGPLALGHRRLSIIDLSNAGHQPMEYGATGLTITYNGEIYNYVEVREDLKALGYTFTSGSDTEVILAAYDAWGEECVQRFNGMWGFAIHDRKRNTVFCARDRFGVKPFYYTDQPTVFAFGSEIRQLLDFLPARRANRRLLDSFIVTGFTDIDSDTFFEGVFKLAAGHTLRYDLATHQVTIRRFYDLKPRADVARMSDDQIIENFHALLTDSVRLRMRSDVKVGTCLSGGLDSSSVAAIAAQMFSGGKFSAITALSEQENNNEEIYARQVVENSDLDWHTLKPTYEDFVATLPSITKTQEEPYGGPSVTMQYLVMKKARESGVTVLLDGQGGDETLLGYVRYYANYFICTLREKGPRGAWDALCAMKANNSKMGFLNIAKYIVGGLSAPLRYGYYRWQHGYLNAATSIPKHMTEVVRVCGDTFRTQALDITSTNLPILLRLEDKDSMAWAIETRLPFLDYRLVEFNLSLPLRFKIRDGWTKWILRKSMEKQVPAGILWRKSKLGFEAPEDIWLTRHDPLMRKAVMESPLIASISNMKRLGDAYGRLDKRSRFRLYSVALWEQAFGVS